MQWNMKETQDLISAILALKNADEARCFLRDLLTQEEILEFGRRFKAARMLREGLPYTQIVDKTGLSSTTVARVSKWLKSGMGGYELILNRMNHHHANTTPLAGRGLR